MTRKTRNRLYIVGGLGAFAVFSFLILSGSAGLGSPFGNVATLSFSQNFQDLNCDAYNQFAVTRNGVFRVEVSNKDGFNPLINTQLQSLTEGGVPVDSVHILLVMECDGNLLDRGDLGQGERGGVVSGQMDIIICGDPAIGGTKCFFSNDRFFTQVDGVATSTVALTRVDIRTQEIHAGELVEIARINIRASQLESIFPEGSGSITFTSKIYPKFDFRFAQLDNLNEPTGFFIVASQDSTPLTGTGDFVYSQYSGISNVADVIPIPDSDGDGFLDNVDACTGQPAPNSVDGCPEVVEEELMCTAQFDPVCGVDGITYSNSCFAGTVEFTIGACEIIVDGVDLDNDGVDDSIDACLTTPANAIVDANGCELPVTQDISTPTGTMDDFLDDFSRVQDFFVDPIEPLFTPSPEPTITPETTSGQVTTTSGRTQQVGTIIEGLDDFFTFAILGFFAFIVIIGILVRTGKAKF